MTTQPFDGKIGEMAPETPDPYAKVHERNGVFRKVRRWRVAVIVLAVLATIWGISGFVMAFEGHSDNANTLIACVSSAACLTIAVICWIGSVILAGVMESLRLLNELWG